METHTQSVEFKFSREAIHRGVAYKTGDVAKLSRDDARLLLEARAGELVQTPVIKVPSEKPPKT